jgi:hypothetical protein
LSTGRCVSLAVFSVPSNVTSQHFSNVNARLKTPANINLLASQPWSHQAMSKKKRPPPSLTQPPVNQLMTCSPVHTFFPPKRGPFEATSSRPRPSPRRDQAWQAHARPNWGLGTCAQTDLRLFQPITIEKMGESARVSLLISLACGLHVSGSLQWKNP